MFLISNRPFKSSERVFPKLYVKGDYIKLGDFIFFICGEIFEPFMLNDALSSLMEDPENIKIFLGEFSLAWSNGLKVWLAVDRLGPRRLYYYLKGDLFIVSTSFWDILKIIEPEEEDLDGLALKELVVLFKPFNGRTFIKNLKYLMPGEILEYDLIKNNVRSWTYYDFRFTPEHSLTVDKAVRRFESAIDKTIKVAVSRNREKIFGVPISGGLDSRIIPYFLKKFGVKSMVGYIIGKEKPHKIFPSYDHLNASRIAKIYNIPLVSIDYDHEDFEHKAILDIKAEPIYTSNILKSTYFSFFDLIVGGGYGTIIGGHILSKRILKMNLEELVDFLISHYSLLKYRSKPSLLQFLMSLLGRGGGQPIRLRKSIPGVISEEEFHKIRIEFKNYVESELNKGKKPGDIAMKYHLSLSHACGAFESLSCNVKSYSIYYPYMLNEIVKWPLNLLIGRKVLRRFIFVRLPELSKIPSQDPDVPLYFDFVRINGLKRFLLKLLHYVMFVLLGRSLNYNKWIRSKKFRKFAGNVMSRPNPLFRKFFFIKSIDVLLKDKNINPFIIETLIKVKLMLDIIYYREYHRILD